MALAFSLAEIYMLRSCYQADGLRRAVAHQEDRLGRPNLRYYIDVVYKWWIVRVPGCCVRLGREARSRFGIRSDPGDLGLCTWHDIGRFIRAARGGRLIYIIVSRRRSGVGGII